jgi:trans-AT polyketide synthase/acyltransferase/oxidoreductase domain-containing protein
MALAYLFPGQGSQVKGMGADLFDRFSDWTSTADATLGYSIRQLCVEDPRGELGRTAFTQPALYVVGAMTHRARVEDGGPAPAFLAGHSLGEYCALFAAGVFDFETGLRLVKRRGELMSQMSGGGMTAVIGLAPARIREILEASDAGRRVDVANFNAPDQTVIAGPTADLTAVQPALESAGARAVIPLKVSAPFHSRYMADAMATFDASLAGVAFAPPAVPVIANVTARPYPSDPAAMRDTLARQIGSSVQWLDSMRYLVDQGVTEIEELGPGTVLKKLFARIKTA